MSTDKDKTKPPTGSPPDQSKLAWDEFLAVVGCTEEQVKDWKEDALDEELKTRGFTGMKKGGVQAYWKKLQAPKDKLPSSGAGNTGTVRYTFKTQLESVSLAGSWNDWKPIVMEATDQGSGLTLNLPADFEFEYKFVDNTNNWHLDPSLPTIDHQHYINHIGDTYITVDVIKGKIKDFLKDRLVELSHEHFVKLPQFNTNENHPLYAHIQQLKIPLSRLGNPDFLMYKLPTEAHLAPLSTFDPATSLVLVDTAISETTHKLFAEFKQTDVITATYIFATIIGTSGCGKTRTIYEFLCARFGLYFVADIEGNGGARDVMMAISDLEAVRSAAGIANVAQYTIEALLLARLLVLEICLEHKPNMTPYEWLLVQTSKWTSELEEVFRQVLPLGKRCQQASSRILESWQSRHGYLLPAFVDEAQVLMSSCVNTFPSRRIEGVFRPLFSKLADVFGFYRGLLTVFSGTGLGLKDVKELLTSTIGKEVWDGVCFTDFPPFETIEEAIDYFSIFITEHHVTLAVKRILSQFYLARRRWMPELLKSILRSKAVSNVEECILLSHNGLLDIERSNTAPVTTIRGKLQQLKQHPVNVDGSSLLDIIYELAVDYYYVGVTSVRSAVSELVQSGFCHLIQLIAGDGITTHRAQIMEQRVAYAIYYFFEAEGRPLTNKLVDLIPTAVNIDPSTAGFVFERFIAPKVVEWLRAREPLSSNNYFDRCRETLPHWANSARVAVAAPVRVETARATGRTLSDYYQSGDSDVVHVPAHADRHDAIFPLLSDAGPLLAVCQWKYRKTMTRRDVSHALATTDPLALLEMYAKKRKRGADEAISALKLNFNVERGFLRILVTCPVRIDDTLLPDVCGDGKNILIVMDSARTHELLPQNEWNRLFLAKQ